MLSEIIRANFYKAMEQNGQSVPKIAAAQGVTRQTIYSYFRAGINLNTLQKIADLVGLEPWQLLTPPQHEPKPGQIICPHCGKPIQLTPEKPA